MNARVYQVIFFVFSIDNLPFLKCLTLLGYHISMKYSNETSLIGKAANSLDIKGAIIGKTLDFIIQFINNKVNEKNGKIYF